MKNLYLLFICLLLSPLSYATHIVGGSITYEHIGNDEYTIKLEVLRDCYNADPNAYFDDPASIGVFDSNNQLVTSLGNEGQLYILLTNDDTISIDIPNSVCNYSTSICIHKTVYTTNIILPPLAGGYTFAYQRCCRTSIIQNISNPEATGMTFSTHINPGIENSTPVFNNEISPAIYVNSPFYYNASATDADGDSLVYELSPFFDGASTDIPWPMPPSGPPYDPINFLAPNYSVDNMLGGNYPMTIDPLTGQITAIPSTLGAFQIAYAIKEYRNGNLISITRREFIFFVILGEQNVNFDISGTVLVNNGVTLDTGVVQIMEKDVATDSLFVYEEQAIGEGGMYEFTDIPPGVFYVRASPDSSSMYFDSHLPTYFGDELLWYNAIPMNQCDTSQLYRDIHLSYADSADMGMRLFQGVVTNPDDNLPVPNQGLLLQREGGDFVQHEITDAAGVFRFDNLPEGIYYLFEDQLNSNNINEFPLEVNLNNDITAIVYQYDDFLSFEILIDQDEDGYFESDDCDDTNPDINPGLEEIVYDGLDNDCDPSTLDDDLDMDGYALFDDCDDTNPNINPGAEEIANNNIDEDCNGEDLSVGTYELGDNTIKIFPNPASDKIHIEYISSMNLDIKLYDFLGQQKSKLDINNTIEVNSLSAGIYLLYIRDKDTDQFLIKKVIIQD